MLQNYKKMYALLCATASDVIDLLKNPENNLLAIGLLQKALNEAEDLYIQESLPTEE